MKLKFHKFIINYYIWNVEKYSRTNSFLRSPKNFSKRFNRELRKFYGIKKNYIVHLTKL